NCNTLSGDGWYQDNELILRGEYQMRILLSAALAITVALPAMAADPAFPIVEAPSGFNWTGGYVGVFGGWAHSRTKATDVEGEEYGGGTPGATMTLNDDGFIGGVTGGYNFQN